VELLNEILRNVEGLPEELCTGSGSRMAIHSISRVHPVIDLKAIRKSPGEDTWKSDPERLGSLELPATLVALLEARLDNLNPAQRMLVQQAAVIGRVFWRTALQALHGDKPVSGAELESLHKRGFIIPMETSTWWYEYRFHHDYYDVCQALVKFDRQRLQPGGGMIIDATHERANGEFARSRRTL
jgi:hypothetical protein